MEGPLHFYQPGIVCASEGSLYGAEFDDGQQECELDHVKESACPESILNFILDADKLRKTQEDKLDARFRLGVPPDPLDWTVDHVNSWVTWLTTTFDLQIFGDFRVKLYDCPLDGRTLTQWSSDDFCRLFGPNGDLIHENFRRWLNDFPESREMQDDLYGVQKDIYRLEDIKHKLINTLAGTQPLMQSDWGSNMSSPAPLSPPMSDDFASHDIDSSHPRCLTNEVTSTTFNWLPLTVRGYPRNESDVTASSLIIEPDLEMGVSSVSRPKRKRGRPRKPKTPKQKRSQPILYKFILAHLNNPSMHHVLEWVNKQSGVFRFHSARKDDFAEMWGRYKGNREQMTYQNMARALRNYTRGKTKVMERVKRKLHYKFCQDFIL
ncbi:ETS homologous factor-like [Asterias amurensis]|uniref:ETS homologous factor-like n=1 Tax=Asterias amurensis TaxID=7602 RepID=UPI003AB7E46A